ncbi:hypothetical protein [Prosthecobacter sp.]|uniref:hypothetical protein n=1 Tax=Prosthecobacter sp. TaxID=1965333 RepID=UPI001D47D0A2|nr:hypothetical protein [Prosthecobacter sp.]MCB1276446.1 hypothetical protein [Prosthecobacter sp.]
MEESLTNIGLQLSTFSKEEAEYSARGVLTELFPFIVEASRRMSTRAISRWLSEFHGVKLSAVSIAKALRNPERYWDDYLEMLEPFARRVEEATDVTVEDLLSNTDLFHAIDSDPENFFKGLTTPEQYHEDLGEMTHALSEVSKRWYCLEESTRTKASAALHRLVSDGGEESQPEES